MTATLIERFRGQKSENNAYDEDGDPVEDPEDTEEEEGDDEESHEYAEDFPSLIEPIQKTVASLQQGFWGW